MLWAAAVAGKLNKKPPVVLSQMLFCAVADNHVARSVFGAPLNKVRRECQDGSDGADRPPN